MCTHTRLDTKRGRKNAKKLNPSRFVHIIQTYDCQYDCNRNDSCPVHYYMAA